MIALEAAPAAATAGFTRRAVPWLALFATLGAVLVTLYPDSYQQDGGFHYLFARWSFAHPHFLVEVWARPLFTALYALPSRLGYPAAKLLTVAVCLAAAWDAAQLARGYGMARAELAIPLLFLQPSFLLLSGDTMTEPLFALVLAIALRLRQAGRVRGAMWVAGLLPLARPEGFFVGVLWGVFALLDARAGAGLLRRALGALRLAAGTAAWWLASWLVTRDPLFILHNWPKNWGVSPGSETGSLWNYALSQHELFAGPMVGLFVIGLGVLLWTRRAALPVATTLLLAALHSVFYRFGLFGSLGYPRYLVCGSVPMALACLAGWSWVADRAAAVPRALRVGVAAVALLWAGVHALLYVDCFGSSRDARSVAAVYDWFRAHPQPVKKLSFSQAYMAIVFDRDPSERPPLGDDPEQNVQNLRRQPPGTLVFWDDRTGPQFHHIGPRELEQAGSELLHAEEVDEGPRLPVSMPSVRHYPQKFYLYYKK